MRNILITRAERQAQLFAQQVESAFPGAFGPVFWPLIRIEFEPIQIELSNVQALLFTSANAVRAFGALESRRDLPALCVGDQTAETARAHGLAAESAGGNAAALARIAVQAWLPGAGDFLHVRGRDTRGDLAGALLSENIPVREVIVYDARPQSTLPGGVEAELVNGTLAAALFFSPRSARLFESFRAEAQAAGGGWSLAACSALCISSEAAEPLGDARFGDLLVAPTPDRAGMLAGLGQFAGANGENSR